MNVLILGAAGQVGRAVAAARPKVHQCIALDRSELDITDAQAVMAAMQRHRVDWVVNCAAYTAVDLAESEPALAQAINADAVGHIAASAQSTGARLLYLSTDFVFDGRSSVAYLPDSEVNPISVYGKTKLAGERHVLALADGIVLRTSWVYAAYGRNFVLTMLKLMRERAEVRVVSDQRGSPTWAGGLAQAIWAMMDKAPAGGVYHWCDEGTISWHQFAVAIHEEANELGLLRRRIPIWPIATADYPTRAARPAFSALDTRSTCKAAGVPAIGWRKQLRRMLIELQASGMIDGLRA